MSKSEREKRYESEEGLFNPITNLDLKCKDCEFAYDNPEIIAQCKKYPEIKPGKVLYGGDCKKYNHKQ